MRRTASILLIVALTSSRGAGGQDRPGPEPAIRELLEVVLPTRYGGADSASGRAMAALWTADATHGGLVIGRSPRVGRTAIEALWVGAMAQRPSDYARRLAVRVSTVQVLAAELAAVDAVMTYAGGVRPDGTPQPETRELLYAVLRSTPQGWRIAASRIVPVVSEPPK